MNEFLDSIGYAFFIAITVLAFSQSFRYVLNRNEINKRILKKEKQKILTTREYYTIVFGILLIIQGSAVITLYTPPFTGDFDVIFLFIGMSLIIFGALMEVHTHTNVKTKMLELESRIENLERD